jgi:hypothetical protein
MVWPNFHVLKVYMLNETQFFYSLGVLLPNLLLPVKLSFLFFYQRYFFAYRGFSTASFILGAIVLVQWLAFQLLFILICIPPAHLWNPALPGRCLDVAAIAEGYAISSLVTDIAILVLPVPLIWRLQLSRGQKAGLTMLFTLGVLYVCLPFTRDLKDSFLADIYIHTVQLLVHVFAWLCNGVLRIMTLVVSGRHSPIICHTDTKRPLIATLAPLLFWVVLEETIAIICACGIVMYPLIRGYLRDVYNLICGRRHYHGAQRPMEDSIC